MIPHEKAKDIYQKMFDNMPHPNETNAAVFLITKQCSLIAVDEILTNNMYFKDANNDKYWNDVKKEIEAL